MAARTPAQRREQEVAKVFRALLRYYAVDEEPLLSVRAALDELENAAPGNHELVWKVYVYADKVGLAEKRAAAGKLRWFVRQLPPDLDLALPARSEDGGAEPPTWETVSLEGDRVETDGEGEEWSDAVAKDLLYGDSRIQDDQRDGVAHIDRRGSGTSGRARRRLCSQPRSTGSSLRMARDIERVANIQQGKRRAGAFKEAPTAGLPAQLQVAPTRLCRSGDAKLPTIRPGARDRCRLRGRSQGCPGASAAQAVRGSRR